ncbi:MBL fold metallo-hydrolase [Nocardiopsis sp. MG754419]|uniref:MBL fold metallo-hydrolase n=1 Tax=Nocardiopsis sp. MG754419 TaxID=2259865 RepID=UPI001BA61703|nr:MBL fold metallo-hydrolase [Nocardiopsis sp. MG754419]MBR8744800.1 MBL fold metallo-hydrolase [Nocardiopsis sp. MG754419]
MLDAFTQVAPGVHRLGDRVVNFYLVETGDGLVMVDAGLPAHSGQLLDAVAWVGGRLRSVVLTHAHPDHTGLAERARDAGGASVWVHEGDAQILHDGPTSAMEHCPPERSLFSSLLRRPKVATTLMHLGYHGAFSGPRVRSYSTFTDGEVLHQVPGSPRVVSMPGHTPGSTALVFADRKVAFTGDALVTHDPTTGHGGPCVVGGMSTHDGARAVRSLERLRHLPEDTVLLPGHGEPVNGGVRSVLARARERGAR